VKRSVLFVGLVTLLMLASISSVASVAAAPAAQTSTAWTGFYYANRNLQGSPAMQRDDPNIDFVWGSASPGGGVPADDFSVRWIRWVFMDVPGNWTFTTTTKDGVRLFVDDVLVIDAWHDQPPTARTVTLNLTQAFHLIRMEYYKHTGVGEAHLQIISTANYPDWRGEYYNNPNLAGAPVFVRNDPAINFNFGTTGPGGGIPGTNFSVRWTRSQYLDAGRYRFTTTTDDGVRLWVDNQLLIDQWHDQMPTTWLGDITLTGGNHLVKMEYFQHGGSAMAVLTWSPIPSGAEVWHGEYFDNVGLSGAPVLFRDDNDINFNWGTAPPGPGISQGGNWSARWTSRKTTSTAGYYTVTATSDDGVRVWVDNSIVIDQWRDQQPTTFSATVYLTAAAHDWRVEYYNRTGTALLRVQITPGVVPPPPPPSGDVYVGTNSAGFFKGGDSAGWHTAPNGYGGIAFWTENNTYNAPQYNWARWYPALPAPGYYEISVYIPANIATTRNARYWIAHAGAYDSGRVSQALYANQWVPLGVFYFGATGGEYVSLSDVTYEPFLSTTVLMDAVKFSPR